jgi:polyvinyl alcohol dehydrogenase (cytochrome)
MAMLVGVLAPGGAGRWAALPALRSASTSCDPAWPMYQHDAAHTGSACAASVTRQNVTGMHPAWFVSTNQPVTATPTVADGLVFVGDAAGTFRAVDQSSGLVRWSFDVVANPHYVDQHQVSYGEITATAAVADVARPGDVNQDPTVFFAGGGTLYALDALTGAFRWATDLAPGPAGSAQRTNAIEILASPVVDGDTGRPQVIVGDDTNESPGNGQAGVVALDARTGALVWKYEPETGSVVGSLNQDETGGDACGDVWSSPAFDDSVRPQGVVVFGTGNCPDPASAAAHGDKTISQTIIALNATTGAELWRFTEPPTAYTNDDDFGSSAVFTNLPAPGGGTQAEVIEAGKSGYVYGLDEGSGAELWGTQVAQPGQSGDAFAGAIGGVIGAVSLGQSDGVPAVYATSAVPLPFSGAGASTSGPTPTPPPPDTTLPGQLVRVVSLHALDAASGAILWQAPLSAPSYAATTFSNGVVFAPATTTFSMGAYDADTGNPIWAFPLGAAVSSGVAIVGGSVYFGAGTDFGSSLPGQVPPSPFPPQGYGIWSFTTR